MQETISGTFTVTIQLGNAAMENTDHLAEALRGVAGQLESGRTEGRVMDENGNTVGSYSRAWS